MLRYFGERLLLAIPTLLGLTILVFFVLRVVIRVDAVDLRFAGAGVNDPQKAAELRHQFGLTGPLPLQYLHWLGNMARGDFGKSFYTGRTVAEDLRLRLPTSLEVGLGALIISLIIAIPLGVLSAVKQDSAIDYVARGGAILVYAVPGFWLATLVLVF